MRRSSRFPGFDGAAPGRPDRAASGAAAKVAVGYAMLAALAAALSLALRDGNPWAYPDPWLALGGPTSHIASAALGVAFATAVIVATRVLVSRFAFAQRLHGELRPVARALGAREILLIAGFSSLGEELLFRGLLAPSIGIVAQAVLFGLAHQMRGPSRWVWAAWAMLVGLGLGVMFAATGSLVGPLLCHALVNAVNLAFLRDHDPDDEPASAANFTLPPPRAGGDGGSPFGFRGSERPSNRRA